MRHAQKHWLELQAKEAIDKAMKNEVLLDAENHVLIGTEDYKFISGVRNRILKEAAKQLVRAELLHRTLTKLERKVINEPTV